MDLLCNQEDNDDRAVVKKLTYKYYHMLQKNKKKTNINKNMPYCMKHGKGKIKMILKKEIEIIQLLEQFNTNLVGAKGRPLGSITSNEVPYDKLEVHFSEKSDA